LTNERRHRGAALRTFERPAAPKRDGPNYSTVTSTGIEPTVAAALSYILGLITGIVFLVLEKDNRYVRFHAAQSIAVSVIIIILSIAVTLVSGVFALIPILGWIVVLVLTMGLAVLTFVLWLLLMWKAYQGEEWELPVAGGFARKMV
jgi:uncharacterized membrane protein